MASTDRKTDCINTTGDAAHAHKLPKVSRLAILFFFSIEAPLCAAVGQRTRGRRPNRARRKLLKVTLKLVCEGRALEAAVGSSANRAAEGMLFEQKNSSHGVRQPWSTSL